jgi:murein DD-endopeptidase MepM/ murein hydrolase activator NlpD
MKFSRWSAICVALGLALTGTYAAVATGKPTSGIVWPTPNPAFMQGGDLASWVQDTGTGDPHSGLFGCVRDDGHRFHEGVDIKCIQRDRKGEPTDPIYAALEGKVVYINSVAGNSNYGRYIVLEHPKADVPVYTLYGHLSAIAPGLKVGETVMAGETIATMGHSGTENIPRERAHMHFEVGVRLTNDFATWYKDKKFTSPNEHGNYNGMNLLGCDPLVFFEQVRSGTFKGFAAYLKGLPTAFTLRVTTTKIPDYVTRYPALLAKPIPFGGVAGWDVDFTWYGVPTKLTPLPAGTPGLGKLGAVAIVSYDRTAFVGCSCRDTLLFGTAKNATPHLGVYQEDTLKMLFGFK